MASYSFNKYCDAGRLAQEIGLSTISKALDRIETRVTPANTTCYFKETISEQDQLDLAALITAHVARPLDDLTAKPVNIVSQPTYAAKTITMPDGSTRKLFARNTGVRFNVTTGSNTLTYTGTYPWVKVTGVQVVGCQIGDYSDFTVYDTPQGTYSGVPNALLNRFAYTMNLPKDFYERESKFDADFYLGMRIVMNYTSVSDKTIGFNILMDEVKA